MRSFVFVSCLFGWMFCALPQGAWSNSPHEGGVVDIRVYEAARKVDIYLDGTYFTSYIYPDTLEKQVLFPVVTCSGKTVTRGFPLAPRPWERTDHPHQVGIWFTFGDVNGLDFWNSSYAVRPEERHRYGRIVFDGIEAVDPTAGRLVVKAVWTDIEGNALLRERTEFVFGSRGGCRTIERRTELSAACPVTLRSNKEGLFGIRVAGALEGPPAEADRFLGPRDRGRVTGSGVSPVPSGSYRNTEGSAGGDVWGRRSPWVALRGEIEGEDVTLAVFDHRDNTGFPAWAFTRAYGLFAVNNLGGRAFDPSESELTIRLREKEKITFRHLMLLGGSMTDDDLSAVAASFR